MSSRFPFAAAILVASSLAALTPGVASGGVDQLERNAESARENIERISGALNEGRGALDAAKEKAATAAAKEAELNDLVATGAERSAILAERVSDSQAGLDRARKRLGRARKVLSDRLVAIYMSGTPEVTDIVLGASDFGDLASRNAYYEAIRDSDTRLASRVRVVRGEFESELAQTTRLKAEADAHLAEVSAARAGIASARSAAETSASQLASTNASREAEIGELKSSIADWEKQIEKRKAASAAEAAQEVARELGGPYAIPTYIVLCESGGNYSALNPSSGAGGAYQILPSTWKTYGGEGLPHEASKAEQDRIAGLIYADSGTSPWVCG